MTVTVRIIKHLPAKVPEAGSLGRHVEHDPASRAFGVTVPAGGVKLGNVSHKRHGGVFDQDKPQPLGSCTGNAICGALNTEPFYTTAKRPKRRLLKEADAIAVYEAATVEDDIPGQYPPTDTGSSGLAVCKVVLTKGWIASYSHAFGLDAALHALMAAPGIAGVDWYEGFDSPDSRGLVSIAGQVRGGHEVEAAGYELASTNEPMLDGLVQFWQSWGPTWGRRGKFYMTARTLGTLLEAQGDYTCPVPL